MANVISNDFVRLYNDDAIELVLDDGTYVQVFYTAKFSNVKLFDVDYKVVESVDFSKIVMLDEYGEVITEVINNHNNIGYDYYKNVTLNIIFNKIDSYDYQKTYKTFIRDFYNDMITS